MPGLPVGEGDPSKKVGSARTSKKPKRKNLVRFAEWSEEHEPSTSSSTSVEKRAQGVDHGNGTNTESAREAEAIVSTATDVPPENHASLDHQTRDTSPKNYATTTGSLTPPDAQAKDAPPLDTDLSPTAVEPLTSPDSHTKDAPPLDSDLSTTPAGSPTPTDAHTKDALPLDPDVSATALGYVTPPDSQPKDAPPLDLDFLTTALGSLNLSDAHPKDVSPLDSDLFATSEQMEEHYKLQLMQEEQKADDWPSENIRPNAQNLRYGGYPTQPAPQHRNTPLGSGRLQNTSKIGNGTNWGFGAQANGAPGLPSVQPSQAGTGASSFAQRVGGSQPAAPLDLSEFPSLSGTSQPQYQNTSQAVWANQRVAQQTPVQRPQQSHPVNSQAPQPHQQSQQNQDQSQRGNDDIYSASSNLQNSLDDHRYGGQTGIGQLPSSRQPQPTSVDEFPPLGRNGTDESDGDRRSMMQNAGFGGFSNTNTFSLQQDQIQSRHGLPSTSSSQANNTRSSSVVERLTSPNGMGFGAPSTVRSPIESNRQGQSGVQEHERNNVSTTQGNARNEHTMNALLTNFNDSQFPPQQQPPQGRQDYGARTGDTSRSNHTPDRTPLSQMSELEEFGIQGFLSTISNDNPDVSYLARGQDLTTLGLNLNSAEPLWPTFAGPFAEPGSRPMQPDFRLPECYTVDNIHGVREKIPSFADETLFWIFYTQTQDIIQEFVATELTHRNWRFHTELKMWLTKDPTLPEPMQMNSEKEQGSYMFFNHMAWEKVRVSNFELHYKQLAPSLSRPNGQ